MTRIFKGIGLVLAVASTIVGGACRRSITEGDAQKIAHRRFINVCRDFKLDQKSFEGPQITNVPNFPIEFEWQVRPGSRSEGILIMVERDGGSNVSFIPPASPTPSG